MKTCGEISAWCAGAAERFGDPSAPVCQAFLRWHELQLEPAQLHERHDLVCGFHDGQLEVVLGAGLPTFRMPIVAGDPQVVDDQLTAYGARLITDGVWAIYPSLNAIEYIHAFLVLYEVPSPAPWERRIVLPG